MSIRGIDCTTCNASALTRNLILSRMRFMHTNLFNCAQTRPEYDHAPAESACLSSAPVAGQTVSSLRHSNVFSIHFNPDKPAAQSDGDESRRSCSAERIEYCAWLRRTRRTDATTLPICCDPLSHAREYSGLHSTRILCACKSVILRRRSVVAARCVCAAAFQPFHIGFTLCRDAVPGHSALTATAAFARAGENARFDQTLGESREMRSSKWFHGNCPDGALVAAESGVVPRARAAEMRVRPFL